MKLRIKFAKYGSMKFIGHLDIMRFFQKAIRRANLAIRYTEGFSPHPVMSFAAPLGVGIESIGEYMDIEMQSFSSTEEIRQRLNEVMVEGIEILSVRALPDTAPNAMASVAAAKYRIAFLKEPFLQEDSVPEDAVLKDSSVTNFPKEIASDFFDQKAMERSLESFYAMNHIWVTKKTKKQILDVDLKPCIYELKAESSDKIDADAEKKLLSDYKLPYPTLSMLVNASSSGNIKPQMVVDAFCAYSHVMLPPYAYRIFRIETYTIDASIDSSKQEETGRFIPLEAVGESVIN
ncbi:MAG: TIGR03936 family radical SAM-associated protein [Blautia sp.]|nr:TIGR03936 family radical SAM-associated protein [Lachnoclostridium sp.]MCM1210859.1 TIGR03936 family radical SAM-associated protein [Blautia sp.]